MLIESIPVITGTEGGPSPSLFIAEIETLIVAGEFEPQVEESRSITYLHISFPQAEFMTDKSELR